MKTHFLYRKSRRDTKSEDATGMEPMEIPMSERKTNIYFDDTDGGTLFFFRIELIIRFIFKK